MTYSEDIRYKSLESQNLPAVSLETAKNQLEVKNQILTDLGREILKGINSIISLEEALINVKNHDVGISFCV